MIVVWRVIGSCNLSCPFCAYDKQLPFARSHAAPADILEFADVLARHQARTGEPVLLSWLGGEPLLWPPLQELTRAVRALGLNVSATTNGTAFGSRSLRRHICENYQELTVSIDGFADFHDAMRGWSGGFEKLRGFVPRLAGEARALGAPLKLRINVVLMHQNVDVFPQLCAELATWGIHEITFNQLGGRDRPQFHAGHALRAADVAWLRTRLPPLAARMAGRGVRLCAHDAYLDRFEASATGRAIAVADCAPRRPTIFIDEHGRIAPCSFTIDHSPMSTRDIRTAHDVTALRARLAVRQPAAVCADCPSTQVFAKFGT